MKTKFYSHRILCVILLLFIAEFLFSQGAAINTTGATPDPSAGLDVQFNNRGMLIPRMTTTERNAISSPAEGLQIFNTDNKCFEFYANSIWQPMVCACSTPVTPAAGTNVPSSNQIIWDWNSVSGVTGYKYNTVNDYNTATDAGVSTTWTQTGLSGSTTYYLYVWSYNNCGGSTVLTMSETTPWGCGSSMIVSHTAGTTAPVSKTVTYGTVSTNLTGSAKCWITQNLGSDNQATASTDATEAAAGWYWQFNKKQGFKHDGSSYTPSGTWISSINESSDWISGNDPCAILLGSGWRIPTYNEWVSADANGSWTSYTNTYSSVLKLHASGFLDDSNGSLWTRGSTGYYWTSSQYSSTQASYYVTGSGSAETGYNTKAYGRTVRCLKD